MLTRRIESWPVPHVFAILCIHLPWPPAVTAGTVDDWIRSFAESEIIFQRSTSNAPFLPLAFANGSFYNDAEVRRPNAEPLSFDQTMVSQGAVLPLLASPRDALFIGEWIGWSHFDARDSGFKSFGVLSVGVPIGWLRQIDDSWQAAAFAMPLGHKADLGNSSWSWQTMGGVFARYVQSDRLWWAFGFYMDVGPGEDTYLPYLGASWQLNDQWTLSAILPWPALLYAPTKDTLFRFGAAPSGASWSLRPNDERVSFILDSWDLGLAAERRVQGNFWLMIEAGVGGLRGLRITGGELRDPEFGIGRSPYVSIGINYRPALLN